VRWLKAVWSTTTGRRVGARPGTYGKASARPSFDGLLPIWPAEDTTITRCQNIDTPGHVIHIAAVHKKDAGDPALGRVRRYVDGWRPRFPGARHTLSTAFAGFRSQQKQNSRSGRIGGQLITAAGHARVNGRPPRAARDVVGFIVIRPQCGARVRFELTYKGGGSTILSLSLSILTSSESPAKVGSLMRQAQAGGIRYYRPTVLPKVLVAQTQFAAPAPHCRRTARADEVAMSLSLSLDPARAKCLRQAVTRLAFTEGSGVRLVPR